MKSTIIYFLFSLVLVTHTLATQAQTPPNLIENIIADYTQQISKDWSNYKLTQYFSKQKPDFHYLSETFEQSIVADSTNIESRYINVSEIPDSKGGYELIILKISYPNLETSSANYNKIINSPNKNLKGGKIFIGYTTKQCANEIILIASLAVASEKIKNYFSHFQESAYLCLKSNKN
jgi:hypothetical protein